MAHPLMPTFNSFLQFCRRWKVASVSFPHHVTFTSSSWESSTDEKLASTGDA